MMVLFSSALRSTCLEAKLQALEGWVQLLIALAAHAPTHLKTVANQVRCIQALVIKTQASCHQFLPSSTVHCDQSARLNQ